VWCSELGRGFFSYCEPSFSGKQKRLTSAAEAEHSEMASLELREFRAQEMKFRYFTVTEAVLASKVISMGWLLGCDAVAYFHLLTATQAISPNMGLPPSIFVFFTLPSGATRTLNFTVPPIPSFFSIAGYSGVCCFKIARSTDSARSALLRVRIRTEIRTSFFTLHPCPGSAFEFSVSMSLPREQAFLSSGQE